MLDSRQQIAIAIVEQDSRFLVGQRPPGVPLAGLSEFPGGKVQTGESPEQAAIRECFEETGLAVRIVEPCAIVRHDYAHGRVELHFVRCVLVDFNAAPRHPFRWVTIAELAELQFPDANREILDQIAARHVGESLRDSLSASRRDAATCHGFAADASG